MPSPDGLMVSMSPRLAMAQWMMHVGDCCAANGVPAYSDLCYVDFLLVQLFKQIIS
jgi:hypothetical protein